jgi:O-antigen ligase
LAPAVAFLVPTLFIPISVDAYALPRATLTLAGGGLLMTAGLLVGRRPLGVLRGPVIAAVLAAVLAAAFSIAPVVSLVGTYGRYESLPMRLAYVGLFCGAIWLGERERTTAAFLVGCAVAAVETLYQAWTHALPRPDGNLGQPNLLGALLAMAIPIALDRALRARSPASRIWLGLAALCGLALAFSASRSGWLGALAGVCVLAIFAARPNRRRALIAVGTLAFTLAALLLVLSPLRMLNNDPPSFRLGIWRDSLSVIAERPVTGWGEDTMGLVFGRHQSADWVAGSNIDRAHSMPLDLAATQGILGLAACAWLFGAWWLGMWRGRELSGSAGVAGAAAAYLASVLLNFDWAPATAAFWLLAGAGWPGPGRAGEPAVQAWPERSPIWINGVRVLAASTAALAGLVLAVVPMAADLAYYARQPGVAAALDPWQPRYQAAKGDLASLRRAAALGDPDPSTYVTLGDAEAEAGHPEAAVGDYRQALERYPYDVDARQRLAPARSSATRKAASG